MKRIELFVQYEPHTKNRKLYIISLFEERCWVQSNFTSCD